MDEADRWFTDATGVKSIGKIAEEIKHRTDKQKFAEEEHRRILKEAVDQMRADADKEETE